MTKKFLAIAVALATLAACSDGTLKDESTTAGGTGNGGDGDGGTPEGTTVIVKEVTATVGEYASRMNGTEWEVGDEIAVVCTSDETKGLKKYTYDEESEKVTGSFVNEEGFELEDGESATFNVYYPYYDEGDVIYASTDDQSITGHNSIDFLYVGDVTTDGETLEATLEHTMCQLTLDFIYDETSAFSSEDIESITIKNVILDGYFDPSTGETVAEGTATDLTIPYDEFCENVILYPQGFANGIEIVVTLKEDAAEYSMTLELSEGELSHGLSYEYDITVTEEGVQSDDNPEGDEEWNDDDEGGGDDGDGGDDNPDVEEPGPVEETPTVANTYDYVYNHWIEWWAGEGYNDGDDEDVEGNTQLEFSNTIYTKADVLEQISDSQLKGTVEETEADFAIMDDEGGVFLFNVDEDDNFTAVAWYAAEKNNYDYGFDPVEFALVKFNKNTDGVYTYIRMVIDVTDKEYPDYGVWKAYTRVFSLNEDTDADGFESFTIEGQAVTVTGTQQGPNTTYTAVLAETYTSSDAQKIADAIGISQLTDLNMHAAGWYSTICASASTLHGEGESYYNYTSGNYSGWYVGTDGYYTETTSNVMYAYGYHGEGDSDLLLLSPLYFGVASSSTQGQPGQSGGSFTAGTYTYHFAFTNGFDDHIIYLDVPVTFSSSSSGSQQGPQ